MKFAKNNAGLVSLARFLNVTLISFETLRANDNAVKDAKCPAIGIISSSIDEVYYHLRGLGIICNIVLH